MPVYEYKCPQCGVRVHSKIRTSRLTQACEACHHMPLHRVFGFALKPLMHEHFNRTVGKPISDMKQFRSELRRASDEAEAQTGIPHNFQPVEWGDKETLGIDGKGIDESNSVRSRKGEALLPEV